MRVNTLTATASLMSSPAGRVVTSLIYSGKDGGTDHTQLAEQRGSFGRHVSASVTQSDGAADVIIGAPPPENTPRQRNRSRYIFSAMMGRIVHTYWRKRRRRFRQRSCGFADKDRMFLVVGAPKAGPEKKAAFSFTIDFDQTGIRHRRRRDGQGAGAMFVSIIGDVDADTVPISTRPMVDAAKGRSTGRIYVIWERGRRCLL